MQEGKRRGQVPASLQLPVPDALHPLQSEEPQHTRHEHSVHKLSNRRKPARSLLPQQLHSTTLQHPLQTLALFILDINATDTECLHCKLCQNFRWMLSLSLQTWHNRERESLYTQTPASHSQEPSEVKAVGCINTYKQSAVLMNKREQTPSASSRRRRRNCVALAFHLKGHSR